MSLLQRHSRLGYSVSIELTQALERTGMVTPPDAAGYRSLMPLALSRQPPAPLRGPREWCEAWAGDPFERGDGGDVGNPETPPIWLFGQAHGDALNIDAEPDVERANETNQSTNSCAIRSTVTPPSCSQQSTVNPSRNTNSSPDITNLGCRVGGI